MRQEQDPAMGRVDTLPCFTKNITRMCLCRDYPGCLPIPKDFYDDYRGQIQSEIVLKTTTHKTWRVKIVQTKNGHAFRGVGWTAFVRANQLEIGDQVMFTLLSSTLFSVRIFRREDDEGSETIHNNVQVKEEPMEVESAVADAAPPPPPEEEEEEEEVDNEAEVEETEEEVTPTSKRRNLDGSGAAAAAGGSGDAVEEPPRKVSRVEQPVPPPPAAAATPAPPPSPPAAAAAAAAETPARTPARRRSSIGTAQEPLEIDFSGQGGDAAAAAADEAGIHLVLKTDTKNFKVFISVSAIEAAATAADDHAGVGAAAANNNTVESPNPREVPTVAAPDTPAGPENAAKEIKTEAPADATAAAAAAAAASAARASPLPRITIPMRTMNMPPYSRLTIEKGFAVSWLPRDPRNMILVDAAGKEWEVKWSIGKKRMLTQGWSAIAKHYDLRVGDFITLEVINPTKLRFSITDSGGEVADRAAQ